MHGSLGAIHVSPGGLVWAVAALNSEHVLAPCQLRLSRRWAVCPVRPAAHLTSLQCVQVSVLTVLAPQHRLAPTPDAWCYWKKLVCSVWAYPAAGHLPLGLSPPVLYSKFRTKPSGTRLCRVCVYVCVHVHTCVHVCAHVYVCLCVYVCVPAHGCLGGRLIRYCQRL